MGWLIFDGYSVLYVIALLFLIIFTMIIFTRRQMDRLKKNSARNKPNINLPFSKRTNASIRGQIDNVRKLIDSYQPRFTDCTSIGPHSGAPYINRMIAQDEVVLEIENQLARIDESYSRNPAENMCDYLSRIRVKIPALSAGLCYRIAFLHHYARFSPAKFDLQHLMELRSLINQFVKIINNEAPQPTPGRYMKGDLTSNANRRRRNKFGGSDGGRQLTGFEERVALLPVTPSRSCDSPPRQRRHSYRNLLE